MRFVSLVLVTLALILLGADMVTSLEMRGHLYIRSIAMIWSEFDGTGPELFRTWIAAALPWLPIAVVDGVLGLWGWAATGVPGVLLAFAVRKKNNKE